MDRKARTSGVHYTDIELWNTATYLLSIGRERGSAHPFLAASVFAFFAFEAYLHELGRHLDPEVWARLRRRRAGLGRAPALICQRHSRPGPVLR